MKLSEIPVQALSLAILLANVAQWVTMVVIYVKGRKK